jgi:hypothetical protein
MLPAASEVQKRAGDFFFCFLEESKGEGFENVLSTGWNSRQQRIGLCRKYSVLRQSSALVALRFSASKFVHFKGRVGLSKKLALPSKQAAQ